MATPKTVYDFERGEYVSNPDYILEQMKKEESALTLPISKGRMYMGPAMSPEEEEAFYQSKPGTSIVRVPAPVGPSEGTIFPPTEAEELARIKTGDIPGFTEAISFRRDVPMPIPEEPGAARFALLSEWQRFKRAGLSDEEARSRLGVDPYTLFGRSNTIDPYREASLAIRDREANLRQRALEQSREYQAQKFSQSQQKEASTPPLWLTKEYESLLADKVEADRGMDDERKTRANKNLEAFKGQYPQYFTKSTSTTTAVSPPVTAISAVPKVGEVRKGYRFKGGNPNLKSSWEKAS